MKSLSCLLVALAVSTLASSANAQISATEPIDVVVVDGQPIDLWFPNIFDPFHEKELTFRGIARYLSTDGTNGQLHTMNVQFDWLGLDGQTMLSDPIVVNAASGEPDEFEIKYTIPFCPERVSLHLSTEWGPIQVKGDFTHECLIPEPATGGLATLGLGALAMLRRKRAS